MPEKIFDGTAEDLPLGLVSKKFGIVLMSHVLEHCIDPAKAITNAKQLISKDGTLVVEVPNNSAFSFSKFQVAWPRADIPRHLNFFTECSLPALFKQKGLKPFNTKYVGYTRQFSPAWISQQLNIWKQIGN